MPSTSSFNFLSSLKTTSLLLIVVFYIKLHIHNYSSASCKIIIPLQHGTPGIPHNSLPVIFPFQLSMYHVLHHTFLHLFDLFVCSLIDRQRLDPYRYLAT